MTVEAAQVLIRALALYAVCGAAFAVPFVWRWIGRVDPLAVHGTFGFRVLVFPGVAALWPLFAFRLATTQHEPPDEWTAHRAATRHGSADVKEP